MQQVLHVSEVLDPDWLVEAVAVVELLHQYQWSLGSKHLARDSGVEEGWQQEGDHRDSDEHNHTLPQAAN